MDNARRLTLIAGIKAAYEDQMEAAVMEGRMATKMADEKTSKICRDKALDFQGKLAEADAIEKEIKAEIEKESKAQGA